MIMKKETEKDIKEFIKTQLNNITEKIKKK